MALPPGPIAHPAIQTYRFIKEPLPFFEECRWHHGDLFTIQLLGIGKCVHVCRPETVRELFPADPEHLHAGASNSLIEPLGGKASVALADERGHARMRRVLNLPLHGPKMRKHGRTMQDAARFAMRDFRAGDVRAMLPLTQDIPLEVILRVVFGIQSRDLLPEAGRGSVGDGDGLYAAAPHRTADSPRLREAQPRGPLRPPARRGRRLDSP